MAERTPAERITVTLPRTLYQRLQVVKESLNVSAICQEAIERAVNLEEIKMKALSTKEKAIERLRLERQKSEEEWFEHGKTDGLRDATDLSYDDFEQLWDLYQHKNDLEMHNCWVSLRQLPENCQDWLKEQMDEYSPKPSQESYLAGWIDSVTEFWDEIKGEI